MGKSERKKAAEALRQRQAAEARRRKIVFGVAIGSAVLLVGGLLAVGIWLNRSPEYEVHQPAAETTEDYAVQVGDGPTVVDLYLDYLCPVCAQFEDAYAGELRGWIEDGSVTVNYHPIAILDRLSAGTEYSTRSAAAAVCAADSGDAEFLDFTAALFEHQPAEHTPGLSDEEIESIGADVGLGADWEQCAAEGTYKGWVAEGTADATENQGVEGTPTAKVNGETVELGAFADEVASAIAEAA